MAINPMGQFEVKPLIPIHVGGYDISFTNQALWMVVVVVSLSLFLTLAVSNEKWSPSMLMLVIPYLGPAYTMPLGLTGTGRVGLLKSAVVRSKPTKPLKPRGAFSLST